MTGLARTLLALACVSTLTSGCKDKPQPTATRVEAERSSTPTRARKPQAKQKSEMVVAPGVRFELGNSQGRCHRTLCIAGPGPLDSEANGDLAELCRRSPGIVKRCEGASCTTVWAPDDWQQGLTGLLLSLDRNHDGEVDDRDPACPISLAGWSTGAVIVADALPKALAERAHGEHAKIENLLATAPYQAGLETLEVAANVTRAFVYRNSKSPANDCSREFEGGPWLSPPLSCSAATTCYDYDYSIDLGGLAYISRRGSRSGSEVGHCNMNSLIAKIGLDNIARGQESLRELIPPYVDGKHGGRELPEEPRPPTQP